jgi:hypothetical protein
LRYTWNRPRPQLRMASRSSLKKRRFVITVIG